MTHVCWDICASYRLTRNVNLHMKPFIDIMWVKCCFYFKYLDLGSVGGMKFLSDWGCVSTTLFHYVPSIPNIIFELYSYTSFFACCKHCFLYVIVFEWKLCFCIQHLNFLYSLCLTVESFFLNFLSRSTCLGEKQKRWTLPM